MRAIMAAIVLSIFAGSAAAEPNSPQLQGNPAMQSASPTTGMGQGQRPPAVHRQPTQKDLPPSVLDNENTGRGGAPDPYGPLPQICRGC